MVLEINRFMGNLSLVCSLRNSIMGLTKYWSSIFFKRKRFTEAAH